jgi:hypothetical protein
MKTEDDDIPIVYLFYVVAGLSAIAVIAFEPLLHAAWRANVKLRADGKLLCRKCNTGQGAFTVVTKGEEMKPSFRFTAPRWVVALPLCGIACVFSNGMASAQLGIATFHARCSADGAACPGGTVIGVQENLEVVKNQPYEAQAVTETERTLADGSHIAQSTTATIARDSEGRTVRVQKLGNGPTFTTILDPVAKAHIDYTSDTKIAHLMPLPTPATLPLGAPVAIGAGFVGSAMRPVGAAAGFFEQGHAISNSDVVFAKVGNGSNTATESLGTKTIEGIEVVGTRSTSTIPAGAIGNDKDLAITREAWHSAELKLDVLNIQDDPRFGQTTYSLTNIQRSEPEAALFQVPSNYKIEETRMPEPPR